MAADDIDVVPVTQLPANSWFEGFAVRPNGHILATRLDAPELYTFDPADPSARPQLLHTFPDANGLVNLCPIAGPDDDEYAVIAATVELQQVQFDSAVIWRVKLAGPAPEITELARVPDSGFCIGVAQLTPDFLAIADSHKNCIWRLDLASGKSDVLVADDTMAAASEEDFFGINRVRYSHGHLWYTNTSAGLLCRVPLALDQAGPRTTGPVQIVASDLPHCDGLTLTDDAKAIFTANYMAGVVWRVDVDDQGKGLSSILTRGLSSPTSVEFATIADKQRLYVVCCGGEGAGVGWVNDDDRASEQSKFNFEIEVTAEVTVTEEVVEDK
ncbi:six-bladed beta-propeller-like protein [Diplodia corticola]|uniref:Six-bladed beta-propeller-like protein n=1 Tax=Diplodia corticola TaxID=236234 RepID=A0A1J9RS79_9PEZI|nr:six-bladed beta-propeller-like protein [Diplodia corticola]OJD30740.1 six-bladed beta-propeller-like protein [Diplodia corticola]